MSNKKKLYCSFCGKSQDDVNKLVAGPEVFICDGCITICWNIVDTETRGNVEYDSWGAS